ncbi:SDR family oxidoreductase [Microbacterium sp. zg.Y1090]|uniref:SDR family NAD(P)-dependent oxidoreductase n=1 Tax=Microbacterium wangruii TaxID=3049073 RepID=UPI00214D3078|nr:MULTISPECIES: SDR family oxidoreductase [unclassified Microbacterium]MCR2819849.1 SDR family oxidoreductase [Microbacterium sp. zg.Y1090]MDL5487960.1 SDR family oxidoreductase [Microbacterium sp. zg-Y1211]WIM28594.1 SDR family oxidoreductase [Microbacterium sp. zg-Y1090]
MDAADVSPARTVVVTGGALGIGGAITRRFARDGDRVILVDIDEAAARTAHEEIRTAGGDCTVVVGDITRDETVDALRAAVEAGHGRVDVLVNNVGDFRPAKSFFAKSSASQWDRLHELNLRHVFTVTHALLPWMLARGNGVIVNVSTVEAFRGIPGHAVYSAYNAGVSAFTKSLAVELGPSGIRVNAIAPDLADTKQTPAALMLAGRDPALLRSWLPAGRFGIPEDFSGVVAFLASPDAAFITGHTIPVDGGTLAASGWYGKAGGRGWTNLPDQA